MHRVTHHHLLERCFGTGNIASGVMIVSAGILVVNWQQVSLYLGRSNGMHQLSIKLLCVKLFIGFSAFTVAIEQVG
jgi:hypothetical protein